MAIKTDFSEGWKLFNVLHRLTLLETIFHVRLILLVEEFETALPQEFRRGVA